MVVSALWQGSLQVAFIWLLPRVQLAFNSGRGLGGSSAINFMMWTRPPAEEIDGMFLLTCHSQIDSSVYDSTDFERLGNPGWNWNNLLRYCNKAERYVAPPRVDVIFLFLRPAL